MHIEKQVVIKIDSKEKKYINFLSFYCEKAEWSHYMIGDQLNIYYDPRNYVDPPKKAELWRHIGVANHFHSFKSKVSLMIQGLTIKQYDYLSITFIHRGDIKEDTSKQEKNNGCIHIKRLIGKDINKLMELIFFAIN